jgi:hypothetical protein
LKKVVVSRSSWLYHALNGSRLNVAIVVLCFEEKGFELLEMVVVLGSLGFDVQISDQALVRSRSNVQCVRGSSVNRRPQRDLSDEPSGQAVDSRFVFQSKFPLACTVGSRSVIGPRMGVWTV